MLVWLPRRGPNADQSETHPRIRLSLAFFLFLIVAACSESERSPIFTLDARSGSAEKVLPSSNVEQTVLFFSFSAPEHSGGSSLSYSLSATTEPAAGVSPRKTLPDQSPKGRTGRVLLHMRNEERRRPQTIQALKLRGPSAKEYRKLSPTRAQLSDPLSLFSPFEGEMNSSISGVLRSQGSNVGIYVDSRISAGVLDSDLSSLLSATDLITLPRLRSIFGNESDIDQNGKLLVFIADGDQFGEDELGFFRPGDLLPNGAIPGTRSNESEIVYVRRPTPDIPLSLVNATIAHEILHLIHFGRKSLPAYQGMQGFLVPTEEVFLQEGLAHLAEDLVGWGVDTALITRIYLECLPYSSLSGPGSATVPDHPECETVGGNDSLPRRGGMMLFLLYLFQQAGGATYSSVNAAEISGAGAQLLQQILSSSSSGIANLEEATGRSFFDLYRDFLATLALDGKSPGSEFASFQFRPEELDPFTELNRNIRMRMSRLDIDGSTIVLNGPSIAANRVWTEGDSIQEKLNSSGAIPFTVTLGAGQELKLAIQADPALALGVALVRIP